MGTTRKRLWRFLAVIGLLAGWLGQPSPVAAHAGAPYPILIEQAVGPYLVSALADPDTGTGTFQLQVTLADGTPIPADTVVMVWATPADGHLAEAGTRAARLEMRTGERWVAKVPFDATGPWRIRFVIEGSAGPGETALTVQVTPPYPGGIVTLFCLLPFVVLGGLWLVGMLRSRQRVAAGAP